MEGCLAIGFADTQVRDVARNVVTWCGCLAIGFADTQGLSGRYSRCEYAAAFFLKKNLRIITDTRIRPPRSTGSEKEPAAILKTEDEREI